MFKNNFKVLYRVFSFLLCMLAIPAHAVSIGFSPASPTVSIGEFFDVDVVISELGLGDVPSVGAFAIELSYDPSILSATEASFGSFLNGDISSNSFQEFLLLPSGFVDLEEASILLDTTLNALQPDAFTLATLTFQPIVPGESALSFSTISIVDPLGVNLDATSANSIVTVQPAAAVEEPNPMTLFWIGFLSIVVSCKRQKILLGRLRILISHSSKQA